MNKQQVLELLRILAAADKARRKAEYEHGMVQLTKINWDYVAETVEKYYTAQTNIDKSSDEQPIRSK